VRTRFELGKVLEVFHRNPFSIRISSYPIALPLGFFISVLSAVRKAAA